MGGAGGGHSRGPENQSATQGQGTWSHKPLSCRPSERAAHRQGEASPDTRRGGSVHQGDPSTHVSVNTGTELTVASSLRTFRSTLVTVSRSRVPGPPPVDTRARPGTRTRALLPPQASPLAGLTSALQDLQAAEPWRRLCLHLKLLHPLCFLPALWQMSEWHHCLKPPPHTLHPFPSLTDSPYHLLQK